MLIRTQFSLVMTHSSWHSNNCSHSAPDFSWSWFCWISRPLLNGTIAPESRLPNHASPTRHSGHYTPLFPESFRRWVIGRSTFEKVGWVLLFGTNPLGWSFSFVVQLNHERVGCIDYSHLKTVWLLSQNQCDLARFSFVDILFFEILKMISTKEPPAYEDYTSLASASS